MTTNREHWLNYTSGLSSPQSFVDWSWVSLICSCLQRRVWLSPTHAPVFPNMYIILVAPPGIGKGIILKYVDFIMKHWKKKDLRPLENLTPSEKIAADLLIEDDNAQAKKLLLQDRNEPLEPLLFPVAPDATTYEALVEAVSKSFRRINYKGFDEKLGKERMMVYGHASLAFRLEELASLLRRHTNDTVNYLLGLFDCPIDYEYHTKTKGKEHIRKGCLNILAGTTPSFMQSTFDARLIEEGFTSRVFYIFAQRNRRNVFTIPPLSEDQKESQKKILDHVLKLASLYGEVKTDSGTEDWLAQWWDDHENNKDKRVNKSTLLQPWYSRKNIHVKKVAMALHFSENITMHIPRETFKRAIELIENEEKFMHLAITLTGDNKESKVAKKILEMLQTGKKCWVEIFMECQTIMDKKGIESAVDFLMETNQIEILRETDEHTDKPVIFWRMK